MKKFPCTGCGGCCRLLQLNHSVLKREGRFSEEHKKFPYGYKQDGSCEMLGEDNKCKVYENRPKTCMTSYSIQSNSNFFNRKKVRNDYIEGCNMVIDYLGLSKEYKINI